jgi:hypothetical protein
MKWPEWLGRTITAVPARRRPVLAGCDEQLGDGTLRPGDVDAGAAPDEPQVRRTRVPKRGW